MDRTGLGHSLRLNCFVRVEHVTDMAELCLVAKSERRLFVVAVIKATAQEPVIDLHRA